MTYYFYHYSSRRSGKADLTNARQGCCISRPSRPNSLYPGAVQSGSAHAINSPTEPAPSQIEGQSHSGSGGQSRVNQQRQQEVSEGSRRHRRPLDQRINKPLRRHEWASTKRTWTRAALDRERLEFFDTRVSGRPEVWQTLKAALEVLWEADTARQSPAATPENGALHEDVDERDPAVALATAQTILNAADILLPTGDLANGAYDALGNYYELPPQIVCDPVNIVANEDALSDGKDGLGTAQGTSGVADQDLDVVERRREEKGKAVVDVRSQRLATIRLSETSKDLKLHVGKDETVRSIIRRVIEETGVSTLWSPLQTRENPTD